MMKQLEIPAQATLEEVAQFLVDQNQSVYCTYNDIRLESYGGFTTQMVIDQYYLKNKMRNDALRYPNMPSVRELYPDTDSVWNALDVSVGALAKAQKELAMIAAKVAEQRLILSEYSQIDSPDRVTALRKAADFYGKSFRLTNNTY